MKNIYNRLVYILDNTLSKGTYGVILLIILFIIFVVFTLTILTYSFSLKTDFSFFNIFHEFLFAVIKYEPSSTQNFLYELINVFLFLTGLVVTAGLIGAITTGLSEKLNEIRNSSSTILEKNHVVILGFSIHVISIIKELIIANESEKKPCIVVLGRKKRDEMYKIIKNNIKDFKNTRVICREGDRRFKNDLNQLNLNDAKSIIINQHSHQKSDVSKSLLAILNNENRKKSSYHIIAVVNDIEDARLCELIGKDEVEIIESHNFLSRLEAQTCRQHGLPLVYEEILNFAGDEIYFKKIENLENNIFSYISNTFNTSTIIGFDRNNKIFLNPDPNTKLKKGDELIGISEDNSTFKMDNPNPVTISKKRFLSIRNTKKIEERFLFLGRNDFTDDVLSLLGEYTSKGSKCDNFFEGNKKIKTKTFNNLNVNYECIKNLDRETLEKLDLKKYNFVVVQSSYNLENDFDEDLVDDKSITIILNLRDIKDINNYSFKIVSELFDSNNHDLIQNSQIDDFILSEKFISSAIAQVAENKKLSNVFREIFRPEGSEIYIKSVQDYIQPNKEINFFDVNAAAQVKNEIAIGYKLKKFSDKSLIRFNDKELMYGIVINPIKNKTIIFEESDQLIVLAND